MRETGIYSKIKRHWFGLKPPCQANALFSSVSIASTIASIIFLTIGYILSIIILIFENIIFYSQQRIQLKNKHA